MMPLAITLPTAAYEPGDVADVYLDDALIVRGVDLGRPYEDDQVTLTTAPLWHGMHHVRVAVADSLGNASNADADADVFVNTGPRPPAKLAFSSQVGSGPIVFGFTPSPELAT